MPKKQAHSKKIYFRFWHQVKENSRSAWHVTGGLKTIFRKSIFLDNKTVSRMNFIFFERKVINVKPYVNVSNNRA